MITVAHSTGLKSTWISEDNDDFLSYVEDKSDHFRLMKHALVFTGVLAHGDSSSTMNLADGLQAFLRESPNASLRIYLRNRGPSRSGFASSSAVSLNLLRALYRATGQDYLCEKGILASLTWLFENSLCLRSGRQDIDGALLGGMNSIRYHPHISFLMPTVTPLATILHADVDPKQFHHELYQRILLVDTGIPRASHLDIRRGLNVRHLTYLTKNPLGFIAIKKSIGVHRAIVEAFTTGHWARLGSLFTEYMGLREQIDPTALRSVFDGSVTKETSMTNQKPPFLRSIFTRLLDEGLIFGGTLSGAMGKAYLLCVCGGTLTSLGGGVMILVVSEKGLQRRNDNGGERRVETVLKQWRQESMEIAGELHHPLERLQIFDYRLAHE